MRKHGDRPWGPPSLLYNGYRVSFPGVQRPGRGVNHPPYLAPRLKKEYSYTSTPPLGLHGLLQGDLYLYLYKEGRKEREPQNADNLFFTLLPFDSIVSIILPLLPLPLYFFYHYVLPFIYFNINYM
jgi:hypothetical protein